MIIESTILLVIFIIISCIYYRKKRIAIVLLISPMAIFPAAHLLSYVIAMLYSQLDGASLAGGVNLINDSYVLAIAVFVIMVGLFTSNIEYIKFRITYIAVFALYTLYFIHTLIRVDTAEIVLKYIN